MEEKVSDNNINKSIIRLDNPADQEKPKEGYKCYKKFLPVYIHK